MIDGIVLDATGKFVEEIKRSDIFIEYNIQKEKLKKHPDLFKRVKEYRQMNYVLQSSSQAEDLFDIMDAFEKEYEKFRENPLVDDFLRAELAFCRMIQEINTQLMAELDFE